MQTENGNDCNLCADKPAELKLILADLKTGERLDAIDVCRPCLAKYGDKLELQAGKGK